MDKKEKKCPPSKILNPETKRCVKKDGAIGKRLMGVVVETKKTSERLTYELRNNGEIVKNFYKRQSEKEKPNYLTIIAKHNGKVKSILHGIWKTHIFSLTQVTGTPEVQKKTLVKLKSSIPKGVIVEKGRLTAQQTMKQNIYKNLFK